MAQQVKNHLQHRRLLDRKDLLEGAWQPTPVFLPGESHGWRSLVGYGPRGHREPDTTGATKYSAAQHTPSISAYLQFHILPKACRIYNLRSQ